MSNDFPSREISRFGWMPPIPQTYPAYGNSNPGPHQVIWGQPHPQRSYPELLQNGYNYTPSSSGPSPSETKTLLHNEMASVPSSHYQQESGLDTDLSFNGEGARRPPKRSRGEELSSQVKSSGEHVATYSLNPPMPIEEIKRINEQNRKLQIELALKTEGFDGQHTDPNISGVIDTRNSFSTEHDPASSTKMHYDEDGKRRTKRLKFKKQKGSLPLLVSLPNDVPSYPENEIHTTSRENKGYEKSYEFDHLPSIKVLHSQGQGPPEITNSVFHPVMAQQPSNPFPSIRYPPTQGAERPPQFIPFPTPIQVQDQQLSEVPPTDQHSTYMNYYFPPLYHPQMHPQYQTMTLSNGKEVNVMPNPSFSGPFADNPMYRPVFPQSQLLLNQVDPETKINNAFDPSIQSVTITEKPERASRVSKPTKRYEEFQEHILHSKRNYSSQFVSANEEELGVNLLASWKLNVSLDDLKAYLAALGISSLMQAKELSHQEKVRQLKDEEKLKEKQWSRIEQTLDEFCQPDKKGHIKKLCDQLFHVANPVKRKFNRVLLSKTNNLADFVCGKVGNSTKSFKDLEKKFQEMEDYNTFPPNMLLQKFYESYKFSINDSDSLKMTTNNGLASPKLPEAHFSNHSHGHLLENVPYELINASSTNINRRRKVLEQNIQNLAGFEFDHTNELKERNILLLQGQLKKLLEPIDLKQPLVGKITDNQEFQTKINDLTEKRDYELVCSLKYNQYRNSKLMNHYYSETKDLYQEMIELANLRLFRLKHFLLCQKRLLERGKLDRDLLFDISSTKGVKLWDHFARESSVVSVATPSSNSREVTPDANRPDLNEQTENQNNTDSDSTDASLTTDVTIKHATKKVRKARNKSATHSFDEFSPILTEQEFFALTNNNSKYYEKYVLRCSFKDEEVEGVERQIALKIANSLQDNKPNLNRQGRSARSSTIESSQTLTRNNNSSRTVRDINARETLELDLPRKTYPRFPEFTGELRNKEPSHSQSTIDLFFSQYRPSSGKNSDAQHMNRIFRHYRSPDGLDAEAISEDLRRMGINPISK